MERTHKTRRRVKKIIFGILRGLLTAAASVACAALTLVLLGILAMGSGKQSALTLGASMSAAIMDRYDMFVNNEVSSALEGVLAIDKVYWLSDDDLIAPEPDPACYGETDDPTSLQWLLDEAAELLDGQSTLFTTETPIYKGTKVRYYLDETILVITWKQSIDKAIYTISEVKIKHPSQFRRFLAGGEYGSEKQYITTEMARSVNAVVASSGDFYGFRRIGVSVYDGIVQRNSSKYIDTCMIDDQGDLHLIRHGTMTEIEPAQAYVDENNIRFSLAFGPILVENGECAEPESYPLGEVDGHYARAALCQRDTLHYYLINCNGEPYNWELPDIHTFAQNVQELGCEKAYALDGGQTAVIAMDGEMINAVQFGYQRRISDIIYFATAIPDGE